MGLRGFGPWLRSRYPVAFRPHALHVPPYSRVLVDVNPLLHAAARLGRLSDLHVLRKLADIVYGLLAWRCPPSKRLLLAVDGAASLPKLMLQRQRRMEMGEEELGFDTRQLTPGCLFMARAEKELAGLLGRLLEAGLLPKSGFIATVDPSSVAGEGEFKILRELAKLQCCDASERIAIVSSDTDLFLYPLLMCDLLRKHIVDVHIPFQSDSYASSILSLNVLIEEMRRETGLDNVHDLVILALISGNDYLPGIPWTSLRSLYDVYLQYVRSDVFEGSMLVDSQLDIPRLQNFFSFYTKNSTVYRRNANIADPIVVTVYLSVLQWNIDSVIGDGPGANLLSFGATVATPPTIESIISYSRDHRVHTNFPHSQSVEYIPGAVGLALLGPPGGTARSHLPPCLVKAASQNTLGEEIWSSGRPEDILGHYNGIVKGMSMDGLSELDLSAILPGIPVEIQS